MTGTGLKEVVINVGLPKGAKLKPGLSEVWSGVRGVALLKRSGNECKVSMNGQAGHVFYTDGSVAMAGMLDGVLHIRDLPPDLMLEQRLKFIEERFAHAASLTNNDDRAKSQDWAFYQLSNLLRHARKHPLQVEMLIGKIGYWTKRACDGVLRPGVRHHVHASLRFVGDHSMRWFVGGPSATKHEPTVAEMLNGPDRSPRKRDNKSARRLADQEMRAAMRGSSQEKPLHAKRGNKKKK